MKKIVFLVPWLSGYGGTESVIHDLFKEYYKKNSNLDFELYSLGGFIKNINLNFKNVHVIQLFTNKYLREFVYVFLLPFLIPYIIIKNHPSVIISTNPILWTIAKDFIKLFHLNIPIVAWYQYSYVAKHVKTYYLSKPDYFLTISKAGKGELLDKGINKNKIYVVYDPVIPSRTIIHRSRYHNQFIYIGRIEYLKQKNMCEMFKALSGIRKPWTLQIYGKGQVGDISKLKLLSYKLHINKNIKWMGFKTNVFTHIKCADALLLTSNYEGFSMVIAEAITHGLYVISSNCPSGPSELVQPNNGNLYKMHDINQLRYLIEQVLDGKKCINQKISRKSISKLYINNYFTNFLHKLNIIINREL